MRLVCVPGFSQTASSFDPLRARLPADWDVVALEVPDGLDFPATAGALADRGGPAVWVGYSMGGRLTLEVALEYPDVVDGLVLISASPGIADPEARAARRASDADLAAEVAALGVDTFLERWLAQPLFATLPPDRSGLDDRRRANTVERLAHQLDALGQGSQPSRWERLGELQMPVLFVTGDLDTKYTELTEQMTAGLSRPSSHAVVHGAGHAVHLERPDDVASLIDAFATAGSE